MVRPAVLPLALVAALALAPAGPRAQGGAAPQATSVDSLLAYPDYFHGRGVVVRGEIESEGTRHRVRSSDGSRIWTPVKSHGRPRRRRRAPGSDTILPSRRVITLA